MNREKGAMQKPGRNRGGPNQHGRISREHSSEDVRAKNEEAGGDAQKLIECTAENLMGVQFERDQTWNGTRTKRTENPGAHRHGRSMFENAQHVEEEVRATKIHDQQNRREDRPSKGREPHRRARKLDMVKNNGAARDHCRHPGHPAHEKIERNFPAPDLRFNYRLAAVTRFSPERAARKNCTSSRNNAVPPPLLPRFS